MAVTATTIIFTIVGLWGVMEIASQSIDELAKPTGTRKCLKRAKDSRKPDRGIEPRVSAGDAASIKDYPFAVSVVEDWDARITRLCGGSIIGERWVLTAAQCLVNHKKNVTSEDLGDKRIYVYSNSTRWNKNRERHRVTKYALHKRYDVRSQDYDIAVLKVKEPFTGKYEKAIGFAHATYRYRVNRKVTILGWGEKKDGSGQEEKLRQAQVFIAKHDDCKKACSISIIPQNEKKGFTFKNYLGLFNTIRELGKNKLDKLTPRMVCVYGFPSSGCHGDNGGPLYRKGKLIGVASKLTPCTGVPVPMTIYTKVAVFNNFIYHFMASENDKNGN